MSLNYYLSSYNIRLLRSVIVLLSFMIIQRQVTIINAWQKQLPTTIIKRLTTTTTVTKTTTCCNASIIKRRNFITKSISSSGFIMISNNIINNNPSYAKEEEEKKKKVKTIYFIWDDVPTGSFPIAIDGKTNNVGTSIKLSYNIPIEWDDQYYNNKNMKLCNKITIYQVTGTKSNDRLDNAIKLGIPRALDIGDRIGSGLKQTLKEAKLINSSTFIVTTSSEQQQQQQYLQKYYQFEMMLPSSLSTDVTDSSSSSTRFLFSTTMLNQRLYVFLLQCNEEQWKYAKNDLLQIYSSFRVEKLLQ